MVRNVTGAPVVGDDLYGREAEIERLWTALDRGDSLLMLAPRRVGKTSLMRELEWDPRLTWDVVYIDVEDASGAADLFARVIAALARDGRYRNWLEAGRLPHALRSVWTSLTQVKALGVELKRAVGQDWASTADYLERRLERLPEGRRLLIIIDELPILISRMLVSEGGREDAGLLLARLRRWRQTPALRGKVQTLIGGSIGLEGVLRRARLSASINDLAPFRVASWSRPTAARFLNDVGDDAQFPLADRRIERMLDLLRDSVPYHVQLFFAALQNDCDGAPGALSSTVIERCFEERLTGPEGTPYLDHYASRLEFVFDSPAREFAYEVLARACRLENGVPRSEVAAAGGARAARTGEVLQALEADGYLERRGDRVAFRSNLVRVWRRKQRGAAS
ncbi:MAG: AAA family ATPase [Gammaproteobacteria bacterium]|nr:AAA family ATPase [Gammaproteobacteria bacterium]